MELAPGETLAPGESVEAVGFPVAGFYGPVLRHVIVRRGARVEMPSPQVLDQSNFNGNIDALRVRARGELIEVQRSRNLLILRLRAYGSTFEARSSIASTGNTRPKFEEGAEIEVVGVADVADEGYMGRLELQLMVQSPGDMSVIASAPWTRSFFAPRIMFGLTLACGLGALWVISLRNTVKRQTEALQRRNESEMAMERRWREMAENASDIIFTLNLEGRITGINPAVQKILGYSESSMIGVRLDSLLASESLDILKLLLTGRTGESPGQGVFQVQARTREGAACILEISSRNIHKDGHPFEIQCIARDVTDRERNRKDAEIRRQALQRARDAVTELVRDLAFQDGNLTQRLGAVAEAALRGADAVRASVWMLDEKESTLSRKECRDLEHPLRSPERSIPLDRARVLIDILESTRCLSTENAASNPGARLLQDFGAETGLSRPMMVAGIHLHGEWCGCLAVEASTAPRTWLKEEEMFVASAADCASLAVGEEHNRQMAEALRLSERRLREIVNSLSEGVLLLDHQGMLLNRNPSAERILGLSIECAQGNSFLAERDWHFLREDGSPMSREEIPMARTLKEGKTTQNEVIGIRPPGGKLLWLSMNSSPFAMPGLGGPTGAVVSFFDITSLKQVEAVLKASEERYRSLVENLNDLVAEVASDGRVVYANPSWAAVLGYPPSALLGRDFLARVHPEDHAAASNNLARELPVVLRFRHREGGWRLLECSVRTFSTAAGEERGVIIGRDITSRVESENQRRQLQEQVYQAHKMESLGTLVGGVAHDFNNLLATIIGNVDVLVMDTPPHHPNYEAICDIVKATHRARELVHQILTFSRKQEQPRVPVQLGDVLKETLRLLRPSFPAGIQPEIEIEGPDPALTVVASRVRMEHVILNLASNAVAAMKSSGGRLFLSLKPWRANGSNHGFRPDPKPIPYVALTVEDEGEGIPPEILPRIFEPFFTTKPPGDGTGLGLAVVHGILHDHDACVSVQSIPGQGTRFTLLFPAAAPDGMPQVEGRSGRMPILGRNERVVIVDDEENLARRQAAFLHSLGYQTQAFGDAFQARDALLGEGAPIDLLITDFNMPGLSGVELVQALRPHHPRLQVILCTGLLDGGLPQAADSAGIQVLLTKPVPSDALAKTVDEILHPQVNSSLGPSLVLE